ncbi:hypothetical protein ACNAN0_05560 [Agrilactobacillus fermenti]|uniref:hypothetical protein n=1 Tax=Agrilactobacillus fermenti TaxID=2586909 RepID=UPI001E320704|nr:hypothetical protein [Agrilactobacillus fermenti]MCD2257459.1 hypothetical protein [Agrilactobacillus fermenti]
MWEDLSSSIRKMLANHLRITIFFSDGQHITVDALNSTDQPQKSNVILASNSQSDYHYLINVSQITFVRLVTH